MFGYDSHVLSPASRPRSHMSPSRTSSRTASSQTTRMRLESCERHSTLFLNPSLHLHALWYVSTQPPYHHPLSHSFALQIQNALEEWETGTHKRIDFTELKYKAVYESIISNLEYMRTHTPHTLAQIKQDITEHCLWVSSSSLLHSHRCYSDFSTSIACTPVLVWLQSLLPVKLSSGSLMMMMFRTNLLSMYTMLHWHPSRPLQARWPSFLSYFALYDIMGAIESCSSMVSRIWSFCCPLI